MTTISHVAVVPARAGSQGIPGKNRLLFGATVDFIADLGFFSETVVTSNDEVILEMAAARGLRGRRRPDDLAGPTIPIGPAFADAIEALAIPPTTFLWLFYIPFVFREAADFHAARILVERDRPISVMSFLPAKTHPYRCWGQDPITGKMFKFVDNPAVSRQDFPPAWWNHHYLCVTQAGALGRLNPNLLGPETTPIYISEEKGDNLVELDEMHDLELWRNRHPEQYSRWWHSLPEGGKVGPVPR